jgi:hypothetical protein
MEGSTITSHLDPYDTGVPVPVLLNPWKHHAGWLREQITRHATPAGLHPLADRLVVIGTDLMDLYVGALPPADIASSLIDRLTQQARLDPAPFQAWLAAGGGYQVLDLADGSRWVLRRGEEPRHVHAHPGRYSPHTRRVRASVLKTAVMAVAAARARGGDPGDRRVINEARALLALPPLGKDVSPAAGLGPVLALLVS